MLILFFFLIIFTTFKNDVNKVCLCTQKGNQNGEMACDHF
jgi:hypothetical protein